MPSRRSLLGSLGVLFTAGCSQQSQADIQAPADTSTTTTTTTTTSDTIHAPTRLEWGAPTTYDGTTVTATSTWSQHSVFTLTTPDSYGVEAYPGRQLLFVTIDISGDGPIPSPDDFQIEAGGERYPGWVEYEGHRGYRFRFENRATPFDSEKPQSGGWIGFALPESLDDSDPALRLQFAGESEGATHWPLPTAVQQQLTAPAPDTRLETVDIPDTISEDESFDVTLTAVNDGDGAGTFRAAVNESGPEYWPNAVRLSLEPGNRQTASVTISGHVGTDSPLVRVTVLTADRTSDREIEIE